LKKKKSGTVADSSAIEKVGDRLSLIGTIHVDPKSARFAQETILRIKPEVVALELDEGRLMALENPGRSSGRRGGGSFLAMMLLERFAGEMTGSPPGQEMLRAVEAARAVGARVAFVDLSIALLPFGGFNLSKLTENLEEQLRLFRLRYPELSKILLDVREEFMVARIRDIMYSSAGQVVAVVGYGHLKSLTIALASIQTKPAYSTTVTWNMMTGQ